MFLRLICELSDDQAQGIRQEMMKQKGLGKNSKTTLSGYWAEHIMDWVEYALSSILSST